MGKNVYSKWGKMFIPNGEKCLFQMGKNIYSKWGKMFIPNGEIIV